MIQRFQTCSVEHTQHINSKQCDPLLLAYFELPATLQSHAKQATTSQQKAHTKILAVCANSGTFFYMLDNYKDKSLEISTRETEREENSKSSKLFMRNLNLPKSHQTSGFGID